MKQKGMIDFVSNGFTIQIIPWNALCPMWYRSYNLQTSDQFQMAFMAFPICGHDGHIFLFTSQFPELLYDQTNHEEM